MSNWISITSCQPLRVVLEKQKTFPIATQRVSPTDNWTINGQVTFYLTAVVPVARFAYAPAG